MGRKKPEQKVFVFKTWGGARKGAGRPAAAGRAGLPHLARARLKANEPQHVTLRLVRAFAKLRSSRVLGVVAKAVTRAQRETFRVSAWSIQDGHLHLVTESDGWKALSNGIRALEVRIARALNRLFGRRGKVFADRYHARGLSTPRAVRNAIVYVLQNARKHFEQRGVRLRRGWLDRFSSAAWFGGWSSDAIPIAKRLRTELEKSFALSSPPVVAPRTWLLGIGWRKHGLISADEAPRAA